jgi:hypothetical protein
VSTARGTDVLKVEERVWSCNTAHLRSLFVAQADRSIDISMVLLTSHVLVLTLQDKYVGKKTSTENTVETNQ